METKVYDPEKCRFVHYIGKEPGLSFRKKLDLVRKLKREGIKANSTDISKHVPVLKDSVFLTFEGLSYFELTTLPFIRVDLRRILTGNFEVYCANNSVSEVLFQRMDLQNEIFRNEEDREEFMKAYSLRRINALSDIPPFREIPIEIKIKRPEELIGASPADLSLTRYEPFLPEIIVKGNIPGKYLERPWIWGQI